MNDATPAHVGLLRDAGWDWRESSPSVLLTFTRDLNIHREPFHSHGSILMWTEELGRWLLCRQIKDCNQSVESIVLKVCWERWMNESRGFLSSPRCFLLSCEWVRSPLWCVSPLGILCLSAADCFWTVLTKFNKYHEPIFHCIFEALTQTLPEAQRTHGLTT